MFFFSSNFEELSKIPRSFEGFQNISEDFNDFKRFNISLDILRSFQRIYLPVLRESII